ncbi:hypothetical protein NS228_22225 [Methylobacterium indicum]|uniref:DUF6468 domain-containing protein n=1 Tax=Methylobacterium indicum TaxID=1775910 RepID=UPI000734AF9D|nr:DUF6468 domain-containing protein [Methylobacterium indicum]KTS31780.1 hypothetical protein NS228_22225 [Methylobacterium indicum]KTS37457.1 hypothetical protein NS229_06970 [Methylobacterium indicum]KTS43642.1 hypothetical protein NS230_26555 [Methylobacterium indicum]
MSLIVSILADLLVAVLLVACIATSVGLGRRITRLKGDEAAMRQTIGDLMMATESAERAIAGLRSTLAECDRTLAERLRVAERTNADLAFQLQAGDEVLSRIGSILAQARASVPGEAAPAPMTPAAQAAMVQAAFAPAAQATPPVVPQAAPPQAASPQAVPSFAPEPRPVSTGERLGAAAAAARALSERALSRLQAQAA